jgi:DNA mismatch repair protein MutS
MTLIDEYLEYQIKYEKIYGKKTIVLLECGSFYEFYGVNNEKEKITPIIEVTQLLNIQLTRRNKSILKNDRGNPLLAGITSIAIEKYLRVLLENRYTVVKVDQITSPPNPKRAVTQIYSTGTDIDLINKPDANNLLSVYLEKINNNINFCGISIIDLTVGKNYIYETYDTKEDSIIAMDELQRFICNFKPTEIVFNLKNIDLSDEELIRSLNISNSIYHIYKITDNTITNIQYQNKILKETFKYKGLIEPIEFFNLEKMQFGLISYMFLIQFINEHNSTVLNCINYPEIYDSNKYLSMDSTALYQLQVLNNNSVETYSNIKSLFDVLKNTCTSPGKRLLYHRLTNPIINSELLNERYNYIDFFIKNNLTTKIREHLKCIYDIERLHRKIGLKILNPFEFSNIDLSYSGLLDILTIINQYPLFKNLHNSETISIDLQNMIYNYKNTFNLELLNKYKINDIVTNIFKQGIHTDIDSIQKTLTEYHSVFNNLAKTFSDVINKESKKDLSDSVKVVYNEKDQYHLVTTKNRYSLIEKYYKNNLIKINNVKINLSDLQIKTQNTSVKITSKLLSEYSNKIVKLTEKLKVIVTEKYILFLEKYYNKYSETFKILESFLSEIDVIQCSAFSAVKYNYCKPSITNNEKSFIDCKKIRHPIIERLASQTEYVPNDIRLGIDDQNGILLYSVNGAGKSSLMKSIGLSIIMAQAGMYVSAESFNYKPYESLFTRIYSNDNLFKGHSSFVVEMLELKSILTRSTQNSLILGDEVTNGTESISGVSIMASTLMYLANKNSTFMFATHLHELSKLEEITEIKSILHKHLEISYNKESDKITYIRKMIDGPGPEIYGLKIAKHIIKNNEFLNMAEKIQKKIMKQNNKTIKSNYNSNLIYNNCAICNNQATDTHHINEQNTANELGFIEHYHKNNLHNLVALCEKCHHDVHHGKLEINGYINTTDGIELDYKYTKQKINKKKYSQEQIKIILETKDIPNINMKKAKLLLKKNNEIDISSPIISKIWKGVY